MLPTKQPASTRWGYLGLLRLPLLDRALSLALPCGGFSGILAFLAESSLQVKVKYFYGTDPSLKLPLRALHGAEAESFHLGQEGGKSIAAIQRH